MFNRTIRTAAASAFYRKRPAVANISLLVRECGLVALTQGFVVFRMLRLLLTAAFYVGRLDSPFLYDSLGQVGGFRVDREPYMFQIDILQHEAHRHPYIETLGVMYLLNLRHRDSFCTLAGSSWRLIFVYVLMPWLGKYRALRRPQLAENEGDVDEGRSSDAPSPQRLLRAVTLVDPQAYVLRAASLVPAASGRAGDSSRTFGDGRRLSVMSSDGDLSRVLEVVEEENRELREENEKLKLQLRLKELAPQDARQATGSPSGSPKTSSLRSRLKELAAPAAVPNRDATQTGSPPESSKMSNNAKNTNNSGVEVDSQGRNLPNNGKDRSPSGLKQAGQLDDIDERPSSHLQRGIQRQRSAGLTRLQPPRPRASKGDGP